MIGRLFSRGAGRALSRTPRGAYGRFGSSWRERITPAERRRAQAALEHEQGVYSLERDIRPAALGVISALALAPAVASAIQQNRAHPELNSSRARYLEQRRLLEALNSELSYAISGMERDPDPRWITNTHERPAAREVWQIRLRENPRRQLQRNQRMREVIAALNSEYAGYPGQDDPQMGLVYDPSWDED